MSDILQKTLASLPGFIGASLGGGRSDGNVTVGIQTFVQNIIALRSKHVSIIMVFCKPGSLTVMIMMMMMNFRPISTVRFTVKSSPS